MVRFSDFATKIDFFPASDTKGAALKSAAYPEIGYEWQLDPSQRSQFGSDVSGRHVGKDLSGGRT